jgi:hypothetical protein
MGISPGVLIANLHLLFYEFHFRQRLVDLILADPDWVYSADPHIRAHAQQLLAPEATLQTVTAGAEHVADAAALLLESFQYYGRYVDDIFSGPNPYLSRLLKTTDVMLSGLVTGLYPPSLRLDPTYDPADRGYQLQMLDVELRLRATAPPLDQPDFAASGLVVSGDVVLYDKLTSPKFSHIYKLRYHHVFSERALQCTYGVICGQLCRFASHTTLPDNWIQNTAACLFRFHVQGFKSSWLQAQLRHWGYV